MVRKVSLLMLMLQQLQLARLGLTKQNFKFGLTPLLIGTCTQVLLDLNSARFTMAIENIPTIENTKTGKITALSLIATLRLHRAYDCGNLNSQLFIFRRNCGVSNTNIFTDKLVLDLD